MSTLKLMNSSFNGSPCLYVPGSNGMTGSDLFADILQPAGGAAATNNQTKPKETKHIHKNFAI